MLPQEQFVTGLADNNVSTTLKQNHVEKHSGTEARKKLPKVEVIQFL